MPMSRRIAATAGPSSRGFAVGFGDGECPAARMRIAHPIAAHDSGVSHLQSAWLMVHPYFPSILCYEVQRRRAPAIRALDVLSANRLNIPNNASQLMLVLLAEWLIVESPVVAVDDEAEEPICGGRVHGSTLLSQSRNLRASVEFRYIAAEVSFVTQRQRSPSPSS